MRWTRYGVVRYGVAVIAVGLTFGLKLLLAPLMDEESPFLLFPSHHKGEQRWRVQVRSY